MKISNTQVAAALVALGHDVSINFADSTTYNFTDDNEAEGCDMRWHELMAGQKMTGSIGAMYRAYLAREWIVSQVVNGNHNMKRDVPVQSYRTCDLIMAACLVADDFYLLKLDKKNRMFHFPPEAELRSYQYRKALAGTAEYWQMRFLMAFQWLLRCVKYQKLLDKPLAPVNLKTTVNQHLKTRETAR